jgi:hypothetical protein
MFSVAQSVGLVNKTMSMTEGMTEDRARFTKATMDLEEQVGCDLEGLAKKVALHAQDLALQSRHPGEGVNPHRG